MNFLLVTDMFPVFKSRIELVLLAICVFSLTTASGAHAQSGAPKIEALPLRQGKVTFTYTTESRQGIWVLNFSTRTIEALLVRNAFDTNPVWSPQGSAIAFSSGTKKQRNIFIREPNGEIRRLTKGAGIDEHPSWSPDGKQIVFQTTRYGDASDLFVVDTTIGSEQPLLVSPHRKQRPRWSPNGDWIVYSTNQFWPGWDLSLIHSRSLKIKPLSHGHRSYVHPSWSTDGQHVVYAHGSKNKHALWTVEIDKQKRRRLGGTSSRRLEPVYTSGNSGILFTQEMHPGAKDYQMFYLDLSTNAVTQVTKGLGMVRDLSWTDYSDTPRPPEPADGEQES